MSTQRQQLIELIEEGVIPTDNIEAALRLTRVIPGAAAWRHFLDQLLLWLGLPALACAVIFFVAYNWDALGRYAKFGLLEMLILFSIAAYWKLGTDKLAGKVTLLVASLLVGALLALYGQTYQTGADPWQLFFTWAVLILPWVVLGRFAALGILWLALLNLALTLYFDVRPGLFGMLFDAETTMLWALFVLNLCAWVIWEWLAHGRDWLAERWAVRLLAITSGSAITTLVLINIFDKPEEYVSTLCWFVWLAAVYFVYRQRIRDLFMLAGAALAVIVVVIAFLSRHLFDSTESAGAFLLIAMVLIGLAAAAAAWLRKIHREWQA